MIASNSTFPELIAFGTNVISYFSTLAVPTTALALTDRLAIRYYVTHSGRTITLHTEDNHLCQIITTFTTGITALNGLTAQVQNFAVGTSGTDFAIASATATHTFNLPTASATNRGALSSADWTTFNNKQNALGYVPVPETRTITINGTTQDLSANRTYNVGTVTSVAALTLGTSGTDLSSTVTNGTTTPVITLNVPTASASNRGALSSADWSTFNGKQNALTLTTTGTSGAATLVGSTLNIPIYSPDLSGYVPTSRTITINGTTQDLSANRTFNVGTVTSVGLSSATSGVTIGSTPVTTSGTITLAIATASGSQNGLLSSTDWTTFNNKQNALTNPVTGTGTTNYLAKFTGSTMVGNSALYDGGGFGGFNSTGIASRTFVINAASGRPLALEAVEFANIHSVYVRPNNSGFNLITSNYLTGGVYLPLSLSARENSSDLVLATSGNVGIGTTTFAYSPRLAVASVGQNSIAIQTTDTVQGSAGTILYLGTGASTGSSTYGQIVPLGNGGTSAANLVLQPTGSNGNVLIGTTTDNGARLQVSGTATFSGNVVLGTTALSGGGAAQWLTANGTTYGGGLISSVSGVIKAYYYYDNGVNAAMVQAAAGVGVQLWANNTVALSIASTGAATFSSSVTATSFSNAGLQATEVFNATKSNAGYFVAYFQNTSATGLGLNIQNGNDANDCVRISNAAGSANPIKLFGSGKAYFAGNVLIGTETDNGSKLQVNGAIRTAQPVGTTSNGWLLGRALISGTSTPDRWIRVQIGLEYYDILAVYMGTL